MVAELSSVVLIGIPSALTIITPTTPGCDCILRMVSSTSLIIKLSHWNSKSGNFVHLETKIDRQNYQILEWNKPIYQDMTTTNGLKIAKCSQRELCLIYYEISGVDFQGDSVPSGYGLVFYAYNQHFVLRC